MCVCVCVFPKILLSTIFVAKFPSINFHRSAKWFYRERRVRGFLVCGFWHFWGQSILSSFRLFHLLAHTIGAHFCASERAFALSRLFQLCIIIVVAIRMIIIIIPAFWNGIIGNSAHISLVFASYLPLSLSLTLSLRLFLSRLCRFAVVRLQVFTNVALSLWDVF